MAGSGEKEVNFNKWTVPELNKIPAGSRNICLHQKREELVKLPDKVLFSVLSAVSP